jgi:HTH-type transcriptional regulator/antitoxin HipB
LLVSFKLTLDKIAAGLGVLIQEARLEKGMTQEQLAIKCGTTKSYISRIENKIK